MSNYLPSGFQLWSAREEELRESPGGEVLSRRHVSFISLHTHTYMIHTYTHWYSGIYTHAVAYRESERERPEKLWLGESWEREWETERFVCCSNMHIPPLTHHSHGSHTHNRIQREKSMGDWGWGCDQFQERESVCEWYTGREERGRAVREIHLAHLHTCAHPCISCSNLIVIKIGTPLGECEHAWKKERSF